MLLWYLDIYHDIEICYDNSLSFYCVHGDPEEFITEKIEKRLEVGLLENILGEKSVVSHYQNIYINGT